MKKTLYFFIRHYLFWFIIFVVFRILFLLSLVPYQGDLSPFDSTISLFAGFRLDISTASYLAAIPFLITLIAITGKDRFTIISIKIYYQLILLIVLFLSISNIIVYKNWGTLLNSRGLVFATQPAEMLASVTTLQVIIITVIICCLYAAGNFFYKKFLHPAFIAINGTTTQRLLGLGLVLPLLGIALRGGLQLIPINESSAVFSPSRVYNQVATNNIWYLGHNVYQSWLTSKNNFVWMEDSTSENIVDSLVNADAETHLKFSNYKESPNVVIILLESWTADIIEPLGGIKGVTPEFTRLCSEGLLFTSIYSSGFRTDQALVSVLSGFPAQPNRSIIRFPEKTVHLPSMISEMKKKGYQTSFYYGGELGFANMNNYLTSSGIDKTISIDDFDANNRNSKWGAHDQFVLNKQASDLEKEKQPFFSTLLTLSTHEPFEVPVTTPFTKKSEPELFKKAAWYTDRSLADYFKQVQNSQWYQNTIFILLADHGHRLPLNRDYMDPAMRKIPVLIWSPLLKPELRGTTNNMLGNQNDLAATILAELHIPHEQFEWSNDLLNPNRNNYAYLSQDAAITWLNEKKSYVVQLEGRKEGNDTRNASHNTAKAYLQHLYATFLAY